MTRHVHAFGDDALGDLDAVALVDALRTGKVSRPEVVEAAIARTQAVNPVLNGLAHENFDQALARAYAGTPYGGYFDGVPTFIKDNVDVEGMPTMQGTDAWDPTSAARPRRVRPLLSGHRTDPAGQDADCSEFGFSASAEHPQDRRGPQPVGHRLHRGRLVVGRRGRSSPPAWYRSRTPTTAAGRSEFRPPATALSASNPRAAGCRWTRWRARCRSGIVANGVLTRSVRDTAAFYREAEHIWRDRALPPIGAVTGPGTDRLRIAVVTQSVNRDSSPAVRDRDPADRRRCSKGSATTSTTSTTTRYRPTSPTTSSCTGAFCRWRSCAAAAATRSAQTFDRTKLDNLTLGLDRHASPKPASAAAGYRPAEPGCAG